MNDDQHLEELAADIEATGTAETVDRPIASDSRDQANAWLGAHAQRLAAQISRDARLTPRAVIRCPEGDALFAVYDVPRLGTVVMKGAVTRGYEHADQEAQERRTSAAWAAPVDLLIAASGDQLIAGLVVCELHIEASISPVHLRALAQRRSDTRVTLHDKGLDVRVAPGLSGGEVTVWTEGIPNPPD